MSVMRNNWFIVRNCGEQNLKCSKGRGHRGTSDKDLSFSSQVF